ncbi:MAG: ATP synthase F0 subunit A, partial [Flavobacteriaceae bacterium]|nr:ATP synthase F0 subunit A [Flavobacteriaceae bacterium]
MQSKFLVKFLTITLLILNLNLYAQHEEPVADNEEIDLKAEIKKDIEHHIQDSHDFTFTYDKENNTYYGFSLPVILWDDGLHFFSSSKFHHGESVAESNGNFYKLYHNKIYRTDTEGSIELDDHQHPTNVKPIDFSITKSVFMIMVTGILMLLLFGGLAKS